MTVASAMRKRVLSARRTGRFSRGKIAGFLAALFLWIPFVAVSQTTQVDPAALVRASREAAQQERYDEAIAYLVNARQILETVGDSQNHNLAFLWNELAVLQRRADYLGEAIRSGKNAVELAKRADVEAGLQATYALNLGNAALQALELPTAEEAFHTAFSNAQIVNDPETKGKAVDGLATVLITDGRYAEASRHIIRSRPDPNVPPSSLDMLLDRTLARAFLLAGQTQNARDALNRRHSNLLDSGDLNLDQGLPLDLPNALDARILDGRIAIEESRFAYAEDVLEVSVEMADRVGLSANVLKASAKYNLAEILFMRGRYPEAENFNREAELEYSSELSPDHPVVALTTLRRALAYQEMGDYGTALDLMDKAEHGLSTTLGPNHPQTLLVRSERMQSLVRSGQFSEAWLIADDLLLQLKNSDVGENKTTLLMNASLGLALKRAGRRDEARTVLERVQHGFERGGFSEIDRPPTLNALAEMLIEDGRPEDALNYAQLSEEITERTAGYSIEKVGESRRVLASTYAAIGNDQLALALSRKNIELVLEQLKASARQPSYLSDFAPVALRRQVQQSLELIWNDGATLSKADKEEMFRAAQLVHLTETSRATNGLANAVIGNNEQVLKIMKERKQISEEIRALSRQLGNATEVDQKEQLTQIQELHERVSNIDEEVEEMAPELIEILTPLPATLKSVQDVLYEQEAMWLQASFDDILYLFLVTKDDVEIVRKELVADILPELINSLRASVDVTGDRLPDFDINASLELYEILFAPFENHIHGLGEITAVPDQSVQEIPLGILARSAPSLDPRLGAGYGDYRFLGLTHALRLVPSPSTFVQLRNAIPSVEGNDGFVGFGDPILEGENSGSRTNITRAINSTTGLADPTVISTAFERLPVTALEVREMASIALPEQRRILLQEKATEAAAKDMDYLSAAVIAFSTHAIVSGVFDNLNEPALILTPPGRATEKDDGLLTVSEIAKLDMDAGMVVLAACNTAAPSGRPGAPGLSGLASGFFRAGAQSLVVSHWTILSQTPYLLMPKFLKLAANDVEKSPAEALRISMVEVANDNRLENLSHPALWGAFSIVGAR